MAGSVSCAVKFNGGILELIRTVSTSDKQPRLPVHEQQIDAVFERGDLPPHTVDELNNILKSKFGDEGQTEKFRADCGIILRTRKQHPGESLQ